MASAQELERRRRLQADALRANLRKRKDQAERRAQGAVEKPDGRANDAEGGLKTRT